MGQIVFQERSEQGLRTVTIGRWDAVPEGAWCAWKTPDLAPYGQNKNAHTAPRMAERVVSWWHAHVEAGTGRAWCGLYEHVHIPSGFHRDERFATSEDRWSSAENNARIKGSFKKARWAKTAWKDEWSYHLAPTADANGVCHDDSSKLIRHLAGRTLDEIDALRALLEQLGAAPRVLETLDAARSNTAHSKRNATAKTQQTRAEQAALRDKGGNPRRFESGDVVMHGRPMYYGQAPYVTEQRVFHYVPGAHHPELGPRFYTRVDADGRGVGGTFKVQKNSVYKVCLAGFDAIARDFPEYALTAHERLSLLDAQATAQAHKARWKAEDKARAQEKDAAWAARLQARAQATMPASDTRDDVFA